MFMFGLWITSIITTAVIADQKKLGVGGYLLLALFTGPLAVIIVLLLPSKNSPVQSSYLEVNTLQDAKRQLQEIRNNTFIQEERIKKLEILISKLSGEELPKTVESKIPSQTEVPQASATDMPEQKKSDLELNFGQNWLNKIGIAVLALGVAFLISYTFKYFGPFLKIAFGYLVAAALFFAGVKLESKDKMMKYGRALLGGAWAIIYFTTYAMYHFEASRIIPSQMLDLCLLALVVVGMMVHVLKYKSEEMMSIALFVAYLTSTIGAITSFTFFSSLLLGVLVLFLVYKFQWVRTFVLSVILTYAIHCIWVVPNLMKSSGGSLFGFPSADYYRLMEFIFLTAYGLLFFVGVHIARTAKDPKSINTLAAINFSNIAIYSMLAYPLIRSLFYAQRFWIVLAAGIVYLVAALVMKKKDERKLYVSDMVAAIFVLTFSLSIKFLPTTTLLIWLVEAPCLLLIGLNYKEKVYRYLSYGLSVLTVLRVLFVESYDRHGYIHFLGILIAWATFMYFCAAISMGICCYFLQRNKKEEDLDENDRMADHGFSIAASVFLTFWIRAIVHQPWQSLVLCFEGIGLLAVSLFSSQTRFRFYAYAVLITAAYNYVYESMAIEINPLKWVIILSVILIFFGIYYALKYFKRTKQVSLYENEEVLGFIAVVILLLFSIFQYVTPQWISLALGFCSVPLIIVGIMDGGKIERLGGLVLLALTLGRVVFIDLSGLDIIFKIITFIVLGILFLGVSFVYTKIGVKQPKE